MTINSSDSDGGSSIGGTIESKTVASETWGLESVSVFLDLLAVAGLISSKYNKLYCEYFLIAIR